MFKNFEHNYSDDKAEGLKRNCQIYSTIFFKGYEIYKYSNNITKRKKYLRKIITLFFHWIYIYLFYSIILIECKQKK